MGKMHVFRPIDCLYLCTLTRLCRRLLQPVQILHILCSAWVTDTLYQPHCVLVVLLDTATFTDGVESAINVIVSSGPTSDSPICPNTGNQVELTLSILWVLLVASTRLCTDFCKSQLRTADVQLVSAARNQLVCTSLQ